MDEANETVQTTAPAQEQASETQTPPMTETVAETVTEQTSENPFDFRTGTDEQSENTETTSGSEAPEQEKAADDSAPYELNLGEAFGGSDKVRHMITSAAQKNGIDASVASQFVNEVCEHIREGLKERAVQDYEKLEQAWGKDFHPNLGSTKKVLRDMLSRGVIGDDEIETLMNPAVFKVVNAISKSRGEGRSAGVSSAASMKSRQQELHDILYNEGNEIHQILINPNHARYKEAAARANELAGFNLY